MANIFGIRELVNGPRNYVIQVDIEGDGASEIDEPIVDVASIGCGEVRLDKIHAVLQGFDGRLEWDGATKVPFLRIPDGEEVDFGWRNVGGLTNPKIANYTGDVNFVTDGLGVGEVGSMTLHFIKKQVA